MGKAAVSSFEPHLRFLLRMSAGFTFSLHGFQKLFGMFGGMGGNPPLYGILFPNEVIR